VDTGLWLLPCERSTILDVADQALLVQYVGARTEGLRRLGIRGAIDLAAVYDRLRSGLDEVKEATLVLQRIGTVLGEDAEIARNIGYTLYHDPVGKFLWEQWFQSAPRPRRISA